MQEQRISNTVVIFFTILWNYILFSYFFLNKFVSTYKNNLYFVTIFYFIAIILLMIPIKKITRNSNLLKKVIKQKWVSYTVSLYCFISTVLLLVVGARLLKSIFFQNISTLLIIGSLVVCILILAKRGVKNIMNTSFLFFLLTIIFILGSSFINYKQKDYGMLMPHQYNFHLDFSFLYYVYMTLDVFLIFITSNFYGDKFKKKTIFTSLFLTTILLSIFSIDFVTMFGSEFLKDYEFIGSSVFEIQQTFGYLGDLNFLFLLILVFVILFRCSYFVYLFNTLPKFKNKNNRFLIIGIFLFSISYFLSLNFQWIYNSVDYIILGMTLLLLPYYFYLIFRRRDEVRFDV